MGSTTLHRDDQDRPVLLISQPGGSFLRVRVPECRPSAAFDEPAADDNEQPCKMVRIFEPLVINVIKLFFSSSLDLWQSKLDFFHAVVREDVSSLCWYETGQEECA